MNFRFQSAFRHLAATLAVSAALVSSAAAATLNYTLQNVKFDDGTVVTGSFTWDTTTSKLGFAHILTQNGRLTAYEYNLDNSFAVYALHGAPAGRSFMLQSNDTPRYFSFIFDNALSSGGVNSITITGFHTPGSFECTNCGIGRAIVAGSVTAVPEAETYAMLVAGLGVLSLLARRRKSTQ